MGFEMSPQTVGYAIHVKIRGSVTEVDVACGGCSTDEARERKMEYLRAGRGRGVEEHKGSACASSV